MFKKFGVLAFVLAGAMFLRPAPASAAEWHNNGGPYVREHREAFRRVETPRYDAYRVRDFREPRFEVRRGYNAAPYYGHAAYGYAYGYAPRCR